MDSLPPPDQVPHPGVRFTVAFGQGPDGLSAGSRALEARTGAHWADLSIVAPASRLALLAALGRAQSFALDLRLLGGGGPAALHMRCAAHWQAARGEHVCQLADISDLQQAHEATGRQLELLQEMVDVLPLLVIQLDTGPDLRCAFAAGALLPLIVPHQPEPVGHSALSLFGPALFEHLRALAADGLQSGSVRPFVWRMADELGQQHVLEGSLRSLNDALGRPSGHLLDALETTAFHDTMAALTASEERLRRFVTASSDAIVVHVDRQIVDANPAACRLLGSPAEALRQRRFQDLIALEDLAAYQAHADAESHEVQECRLVDRQGARIAVELIGRTVLRQGRRMRMAIVRDVRDQREAQARIRELIDHLSLQKDRAEAADRAKSLFLAAASHDLRQPIHALGLFLTGLEELIRAPELPAHAFDEVVQRMNASLHALSRLLNSLLDVSRLDADAVVVHPMPVSLDALFGELAEDFAEAAREKGLQLDVVPSSAWVHTDPGVLHRILDNLISNALRYTRSGRVLVGARSRGALVELQVWDSGIGIAADQLGAIFGEFYQVDPGSVPVGGLRGLGLGLSIVKRSARLLQAPLKVRSTPGRGSMFSIAVPRGESALARPAAAPAQPPHAKGPARAQRHVLVIDDDDLVLQAMQQLLQAWGHQVWCASGPDQAIVLAVEHADSIDLVLSDYHLGEQVHALQFIDELRGCLQGPAPVHVFTADTSAQVAREIRARGFSLLHKPVRHEALQQILEQALP